MGSTAYGPRKDRIMRDASISQLDLEDEPTAKTCAECKGAGTVVHETGTRYTVSTCAWCKGSGRIPVSQTMRAVTVPQCPKAKT